MRYNFFLILSRTHSDIDQKIFRIRAKLFFQQTPLNSLLLTLWTAMPTLLLFYNEANKYHSLIWSSISVTLCLSIMAFQSQHLSRLTIPKIKRLLLIRLGLINLIVLNFSLAAFLLPNNNAEASILIMVSLVPISFLIIMSHPTFPEFYLTSIITIALPSITHALLALQDISQLVVLFYIVGNFIAVPKYLILSITGINGLYDKELLLQEKTELHDLKDAMQHMAMHDELTGLSNRRHFNQQIQNHVIPNNLQGLLYIDLNKFKQINDQYGHEMGDKVLQYVAISLSQAIHPPSTTYRLGGDEFCAIIQQTTLDIQHIAQQIEHKLSREIIVDDIAIQLSACVGHAYYPQQGSSIKALLSVADQAMYRKKAVRTNDASLMVTTSPSNAPPRYAPKKTDHNHPPD